MKYRLAYLSYPYSDNPKKRTKEVSKLAKQIIHRRKDLILIIPHLVIDKGMKAGLETNEEVLEYIPCWEYELR